MDVWKGCLAALDDPSCRNSMRKGQEECAELKHTYFENISKEQQDEALEKLSFLSNILFHIMTDDSISYKHKHSKVRKWGIFLKIQFLLSEIIQQFYIISDTYKSFKLHGSVSVSLSLWKLKLSLDHLIMFHRKISKKVNLWIWTANIQGPFCCLFVTFSTHQRILSGALWHHLLVRIIFEYRLINLICVMNICIYIYCILLSNKLLETNFCTIIHQRFILTPTLLFIKWHSNSICEK